MSRFAILGASSFSGSACAEYLREQGHEVLELHRPLADLNSGTATIAQFVKDFRAQYFVNFAALNMVAESWPHFADYYRTNVIGVARLAEALRNLDCIEKFVQVSTPEVYGTTEAAIAEGQPFNPSTPYAVSRAAADMHLLALHHTFGLPVCFTRTVNVYGPRQQLYRIIPRTVLSIYRGQRIKLHGGGVSSRSFLHVRDMASAIAAVAQRGTPGQAYHASNPDVVRIRDLVDTVAAILGRRLDEVAEDDHERPGKDMAYLLDDSRIRRELGWSHSVELAGGLRETVKWFNTHAADFAGESLNYEHRG